MLLLNGATAPAIALMSAGAAVLVAVNLYFLRRSPTLDVLTMVLGAVFLGSQFIGEKNLIERTLGSQIHLPKPVWTRLNLLWVSNFVIVGGLNLVVAYGFSEATWVSYKLYSAIGFTLVLTILTAIMISPHLKEEQISDP